MTTLPLTLHNLADLCRHHGLNLSPEELNAQATANEAQLIEHLNAHLQRSSNDDIDLSVQMDAAGRMRYQAVMPDIEEQIQSVWVDFPVTEDVICSLRGHLRNERNSRWRMQNFDAQDDNAWGLDALRSFMQDLGYDACSEGRGDAWSIMACAGAYDLEVTFSAYASDLPRFVVRWNPTPQDALQPPTVMEVVFEGAEQTPHRLLQALHQVLKPDAAQAQANTDFRRWHNERLG